MHSSECHTYADQCMQIARNVAPQHRATLLDLARRWCDAADDLERHEIRFKSGKIDGRASSGRDGRRSTTETKYRR